MMRTERGEPVKPYPRRQLAVAAGLLLVIPKPLKASVPLAVDRAGEQQEEADIPAGVVVLRIADVTATMENVVLQAAAFQRSGSGDELVIGRAQMQQSVKILLEKSKLEAIPKSRQAVEKLKSISRIAEQGQGPLTAEELKKMAHAYSQARDALQPVFEQYSKHEKTEFRLIFARMQQADRLLIRAL